MTTEDRLRAIECVLALMPSGKSWESRAVYLAFQFAGDREPVHIADAMTRLENVRPGFLREVEDWARDMYGQDVAAVLRMPEPAALQQNQEAPDGYA